MKRLISRYLSQMEEKKEEEIITLEDLENTKQDLLKEVSNLWQRKSIPLIFRQNVESKRLKDLETTMQELLREIKNLPFLKREEHLIIVMQTGKDCFPENCCVSPDCKLSKSTRMKKFMMALKTCYSRVCKNKLVINYSVIPLLIIFCRANVCSINLSFKCMKCNYFWNLIDPSLNFLMTLNINVSYISKTRHTPCFFL